MRISRLYTSPLLEAAAIEPWKLNMTAVSSQHALLLVAARKDVLVYDINHFLQPPALRSRLEYPDRSQQDEINAITLDTLFGDEIMVAVYDSGRAIAWRVGGSFELLWVYQNTASTWGCAVHGPTNTIAISANSTNITVLRPARMNVAQHMAEDASEVGGIQSRPFTGEVMLIEQHHNNIPCVAFSACGNYLSSASIDQTFRIWSTATGQEVCRFDYAEWGWSALFVYPYYFIPAALVGEVVSDGKGVLLGDELRNSSLDSAHGHAGLFGDLATELAALINSAYREQQDQSADSGEETSEGSRHADDNNDHGMLELIRDRTVSTVDEEAQAATQAATDGTSRSIDGIVAPTTGEAGIVDQPTQSPMDPAEGRSPLPGDNDEAQTPRSLPTGAFDHSSDMQNGHTAPSTAMTATTTATTATTADDQQSTSSGTKAIEAKGIVTSAANNMQMSSPLLLCCSANDALLLDPSTHNMSVVHCLKSVTLDVSSLQPFVRPHFERMSFLSWVPELGVAVIGAHSGKVVVVNLQKEPNGEPQRQQSKFYMRTLAKLPADADANSLLYGMSIYRYSVQPDGSCSVILYLTFLDGKLMAYELSASLDVADAP
ncbi:hypothetical protein GGI12_002180 [Dipsacomyces acuminosporus]|nr:hypothetical protein GGI12_002180 [Dipsacomyces acuminosporus]